jgi:hypothetical protein
LHSIAIETETSLNEVAKKRNLFVFGSDSEELQILEVFNSPVVKDSLI